MKLPAIPRTGCLLLWLLLSYCGQTQSPSQSQTKDKPVGGPCDRCDEMYAGMPAIAGIGSQLAIAGNDEPGERMILHGKAVQKDGKTPAANVILYLYHTDHKGEYSPGNTQTQARVHGHLRGWVKTDAAGKFTVYTIRPAAYPGRNTPAHIHILVKEPGKTRYYIDEVWFDDDTFITQQMRDRSEKRGGNMIIHLTKNKNNTWETNLNITLGLHIPGYE